MDLNQMNIDPREALAVGAIAHDLLKPERVEDLEAFLAQYPQVAQYIEQYLGFGYASIPPEIVISLAKQAQAQEPQPPEQAQGPMMAEGLQMAGVPQMAEQAPGPEVPEELLSMFTEVGNAEGDTEPQPRPDIGLL
jgi:hypothetical protein